MSKKVKMLKKLIEKIEDYKDRPLKMNGGLIMILTDAFMNGYNIGLDTSISLLNEKIEDIEKAED